MIEGVENLLWSRAHGDIVRKIDPSNQACGINQKLRRPRDVRLFWTRTGMAYIVTANDFGLGIGKQRKSVAEFLRLPPVNLRWIDADTDDADSSRIKIRKPPLKTP